MDIINNVNGIKPTWSTKINYSENLDLVRLSEFMSPLVCYYCITNYHKQHLKTSQMIYITLSVG